MEDATGARVAQMTEMLRLGRLDRAGLEMAAEAAAKATGQAVEAATGLHFETDPPAFAAVLRSGGQHDG